MKQFINYAHRGASEYCPENTLLSFYTGVYMGANGIETDVQLTKDGIPVLFHDDTIQRMMGKEGYLCDYTYAQLREFPMKTCGRTDYIITLEQFLESFSKMDLTFAIELKGKDVEEKTAALIKKYGVQDKCIVTSFQFAYLENMHAVDPCQRLGYLAPKGKITRELLDQMLAMGFYEICPHAEDATAENVQAWHEMGLDVRAWGVANEELMRQAYDNGVDGMTVNFPDKLVAYRAQKEK